MRPMASVMPKGVRWHHVAVEAFEPEHDRIVLADGTRLAYRVLIAAPGIKNTWKKREHAYRCSLAANALV
jgi:sulfide:quinone oxidoreductase